MIKTALVVFLSIIKVNSYNNISLSKNTLRSDENPFYDTNIRLQNTIIKVISLLKSRNNSDQYETRLLLPVFATLNNIADKKYKIFKDLKEASRLALEFYVFQNTSLFKLEKPIGDLMTKEFNTRNYSDPIEIKMSINFLEMHNRSEEIEYVLSEYLSNAKKLNLTDNIEMQSQLIRKVYNSRFNRFQRARRRNLKVWEPSNSLEKLSLNHGNLSKSNRVIIEKFPFVASIHVKNVSICTGAVINKNMVITAASCLYGTSYDPNDLQNEPHSVAVRVGSQYIDSLGDVIEAANVFLHPEFNFDTLSNNVAIIKLSKHLNDSNKNMVKRIKSLNGTLPESVREITLLGWGYKENPPKTNQLTYSHLKLMQKTKDCMGIYTEKYVTKDNFCAGFSKNVRGACQFDLGGPAIVGDKLVGLVSFGPSTCGTPDTPIVFTNIGLYSKWINSIKKRISLKVFRRSLKEPWEHRFTRDKHFPSRLTATESIVTTTTTRKQTEQTHKYFYYDDDFFETEPDSHLWIRTTVDLHHHPLINQSMFIMDYLAPIETDPPTSASTITSQPLDELILEYYFEEKTGSRIFPARNQPPVNFTTANKTDIANQTDVEILTTANGTRSGITGSMNFSHFNIKASSKISQTAWLKNNIVSKTFGSSRHKQSKSPTKPITFNISLNPDVNKSHKTVTESLKEHIVKINDTSPNKHNISSATLNATTKDPTRISATKNTIHGGEENKTDKAKDYVFALRQGTSVRRNRFVHQTRKKNIVTASMSVTTKVNSDTKKSNCLCTIVKKRHFDTLKENNSFYGSSALKRNESDYIKQISPKINKTSKHLNHKITTKAGKMLINSLELKPFRIKSANVRTSDKETEIQKLLVLLMEREIDMRKIRPESTQSDKPKLETQRKRIIDLKSSHVIRKAEYIDTSNSETAEKDLLYSFESGEINENYQEEQNLLTQTDTPFRTPKSETIEAYSSENYKKIPKIPRMDSEKHKTNLYAVSLSQSSNTDEISEEDEGDNENIDYPDFLRYVDF